MGRGHSSRQPQQTAHQGELEVPSENELLGKPYEQKKQ